MSVEDNDNIYVLEEDQDRHLQTEGENDPRNFASYDIEDKDDLDELESSAKGVSAFGIMIKTLVNPVEGWKRLRRSKLSVEAFQSGCFYPLLALLAVSKFAEYIYSVNVNLSQVTTQAVVAFVAYFFGYFCIINVMGWVVPKEMIPQIESRFGKSYYILSLSTLALFSILIEILPMIWPILIFLPLWTIYVMFKGVRFFKMPVNHEMKFFVLSSGMTIGFPLLIDWALNSVLPY